MSRTTEPRRALDSVHGLGPDDYYIDGLRDQLADLIGQAGPSSLVKLHPNVCVLGARRRSLYLSQGPRDPEKAPSARDRDLGHLRGESGLRFYEQDGFSVLRLAEVELQRRARVPNRARARKLLRPVQVAQRRVVERAGKGRCRNDETLRAETGETNVNVPWYKAVRTTCGF